MHKLKWCFMVAGVKDWAGSRAMILLGSSIQDQEIFCKSFCHKIRRYNHFPTQSLADITFLCAENHKSIPYLAVLYKIAEYSMEDEELEDAIFHQLLIQTKGSAAKLIRKGLNATRKERDQSTVSSLLLHYLKAIVQSSGIAKSTIDVAEHKIQKLNFSEQSNNVTQLLNNSLPYISREILNTQLSIRIGNLITNEASAINEKRQISFALKEALGSANKWEAKYLKEASENKRLLDKISKQNTLPSIGDSLHTEEIESMAKELEEARLQIMRLTRDTEANQRKMAKLEEELMERKKAESFCDIVYELLSQPDIFEETPTSLADVLEGYRLIVFGGYPEWRKELSKLLDLHYRNYRIFDFGGKSALPKINNNDILLVNVRGMSHSSYYAIIDKLRGSGGLLIQASILGISRVKELLEVELERHKLRSEIEND